MPTRTTLRRALAFLRLGPVLPLLPLFFKATGGSCSKTRACYDTETAASVTSGGPSHDSQ